MKNKFLNICFGVAILFMSGGFFIRSINSANAAPPSPKEFIEEGTSKIGKYQMSMGAADDNGCKVIIINTESGETVY